MTATTFDGTPVQAAPRRSVEDAWRRLNQRYSIGTGVLVALLLLLPWVFGIGPGSWRAVEPDAATAPGAAATAASTPAAGTGAAPASGAAATGAASGAPSGATAGVPSGGPAGASTSASAAPAPAASPASGGTASGAAADPSRGTSASGPTNGALPAPVPGAPVARLFFEPDQAWPTGEVGPRLAPVLARLKAEPDTKALVSGYHDRRGSVERNQALAQRRAQTVRRVLVREGIAADRIVLAKPQQTQGSGSDREARRVEVAVAR